MNNRKKIKVARLFTRYIGLQSHFLFDILQLLNNDQFEVICIFLKRGSDLPNFLEDRGVRCFYISDQDSLKGLNLKALKTLIKVLRDEEVDILHCDRHQATVYGTIASVFAKVPVVISHVHGLNRAKRWNRRLMYRILNFKIDRFIGCSKRVAQDVLANFGNPKKGQVLHIDNSVDADAYANVVVDRVKLRSSLNIPDKSFLFLAVGRLAPTKGYDNLIAAFSQVVNEYPNVHLLFLGDGRLRNDLEKQVCDLNISDNVLFLGKVSDVGIYLKASDCFVMSSLAEGMPLSILEAMAAGLPVISTAVGGIPEIIPDDSYGLLVPPGDVDALKDAMVSYLEKDDIDLSEISKRAKNRIYEKYTHDIAVSKLKDVYMSCYKEKKG